MKSCLKQVWSFAFAFVLLSNANYALADTASDTEILLNWAQKTYAELFPSVQGTRSLDPWIYRYYPETGIYAGVNTEDLGAYVLGGPFGDSPTYVDSLANLISQIDDSDGSSAEQNESGPALLSPEGKVASFEQIAPQIQTALVDDDPDSPIAATLVFQPDDHGIDKIVLFGPKIDSGELADFAVVHFAESDTTAYMDIDQDGRLSSISSDDVSLHFNHSGSGLILELQTGEQTFESDEISLESDEIILEEELDFTLAKFSARPSNAEEVIVEWRDDVCAKGVSSVVDKTTVCMFIHAPVLAGKTVTIQTVEVDLFSDDAVGGLINLTLDGTGKASTTNTAVWRDDEGSLGNNPEYRFNLYDYEGLLNDGFNGVLYKSPKLYVTKENKPDILQVNRGVAVELLFDVQTDGASMPAESVFNPIIYPECDKGNIYTCRTWSTPPSGNYMTVGVVHTASLARSPDAEPAPDLDPEICESWFTQIKQGAVPWIGTFAAGTVVPASVPALLSAVENLFVVAGAAVTTSVSAPQAILAGLVGALAYEGGYWAGSQLAGPVDCQAVLQRAQELTNLTTTIQSTEFNPIKVCMATITGWTWDEPCQEMRNSYQPFNPLLPLQSLGQLNFALQPTGSQEPQPSDESISIVYYRNFDDEQNQSIKNSQTNSGFDKTLADVQVSGTLDSLRIAWSGGSISAAWLAEVDTEGFGENDAHTFLTKRVLYHVNQKIVSNDDYGNTEANIIASSITYGDYDIVGAGPAHSNVVEPAPALDYDKTYEIRVARITPPAAGEACRQGTCSEIARVAFIIKK